MNSGSAASSHEALLPQILVASTGPAGIPPPTNCMPTQPHAISAIAIQTPPASSTPRNKSSTAAIVTSSTLHSALDGPLDHFFGALRLWFLVARHLPAQHMHQLVDEGDQQDDEAAGITELRYPQRYGEHALRHVVEAPGIVVHRGGMPGEEADEAAADEERSDLDEAPRRPFEVVDQQPDADHFTGAKRMRQPEEGTRRHAPGNDVVTGRDVDPERPPRRQRHHQHENGDHEGSGEVAGGEIEPIKDSAQHCSQYVGMPSRPARTSRR